MKKKVISIALVTAMTVSLVACGSSTASDTAATAAPAATSEAAVAESSTAAGTAEEKTEASSVSLWTWSPITRTADKMIAAFEKDNPDITVEYTNYNYNP